MDVNFSHAKAVRIAGRLDRFAALLERCRLPWLPERLRRRGGRMRTSAMRDAVKAVSEAGGGTVWVASGRYDVR